jgi:DNA-directed RNA polymerase specialized sigma24 family protein
VEVPALSADEARQIAEGIRGLGPAVADALEQRYEGLWTRVLAAILPGVQDYLSQKLGARVRVLPEDVAQSLARTLLRRGRSGELQALEFEDEGALTVWLIRFAWNKALTAIKKTYHTRLDVGEDFEEETSDPKDCRPGPVDEVLRAEVCTTLRDTLDRLLPSFDPVDQVILKEKLADAGRSAPQIAQTIEKTFPDRGRSSVRTVQLRWQKIRQRLKRLLPPPSDPGEGDF